MIKKLIFGGVILILLLVLASGVASAAPPFVQTSELALIEMRIPQVEFLEVNKAYSFRTHVFNGTDGLPLYNDTTSCLIHIYNSTGQHIVEEEMGFDGNNIDFDISINSSVFSVMGFHSFILQCNSSSIGGFIAGSFEVTETGQTQTFNNYSFLFAGLVFMFFSIITLVSIYLSKTMHIKVILTILLTILITSLLRFAGWFIEITNSNETILISTLQRFYGFTIWGMRISILFAVFYLIYLIFESVLTWKKKEKEGDWKV